MVNKVDLRTGLFLGAGASFELGQPLVWDITTELKGWLMPEKLSQIKVRLSLDDSVISEVEKMLARNDVHYESLIGYLEARSNQSNGSQFGNIKDFLLDIISGILYFRHINQTLLIEQKLPLLRGISSLAELNRPLWVYTLNHDLIIECLALKYSMPLTAGLFEVSTLPRRRPGQIIGKLPIQVLQRKQGEPFALQFFPFGTHGINLVKIHGSLDLFLQNDKTELIRFLPVEPTVAGILNSLKMMHEDINLGLSFTAGPPNEIAYKNWEDEYQFLRRSVLSGAFKYNTSNQQVLPLEFLSIFQSELGNVDRLIAIGYGFGDIHINNILRQWLEFSNARILEIVSPGASSIPPSVLHLTTQIELHAMTTSEFLKQFE